MEKNGVVRVPLIPGVNNDEKYLIQLAEMACWMEQVKEVQLVPYHSGAELCPVEEAGRCARRMNQILHEVGKHCCVGQKR